MDEKTKELLMGEMKSIVDQSIKENLGDVVSTQVSETVKSIVAKMRVERALYGSDASGISDEQKLLLAEDFKNIANGKLFNGQAKAAILSTSDEAGGYLIPAELYSGILRVAASAGLVARDAMRMPMGSTSMDVPRYTGADLEGSYVGEDTEGSETTVTFGDAKLVAKTWMVIIRVSNTMLNNTSVNLTDWLIGLIAEGLSVKLDKEGFKGGTYAGSPFVGLLGSTDVTVYTMASGKDTFAEFDMDEASDVIAQMPESLLNGAAFYFNRTVWAKIRQKKDTAGAYVVGANGGIVAMNFKKEGIQPAGELWNFPVFTTDQLPTNTQTAVSTKFGVFANLSKALIIGDRGSMALAQSDSATVGGKNVFAANQKAIRVTHDHAIAIGLPSAAVVIKTAAA
jgi:HK97 family phage major capsid protein